jgi:hypothetical protein
MSMFEVGQSYRFKIGIADDVWEGVETVLQIDGPLLMLEGPPGHVRIVNTNAPSFHSAEPFEGRPGGSSFDIDINLR